MTMFEAIPWRKELSRPRAALAIALAVALIVALLPRGAINSMAGAYQRSVEPGRLAAGYLSARCTQAAEYVRHASATGEEMAALAAEARRLRARNRELEAALLVAQCHAAESGATSAEYVPAALLTTQTLRAQVLGQRACAALGMQTIVDRGRDSGAAVDALVLADSATTIDQGENARVVLGDLALAGRRVFGKVIEVGPHTAIVRRASQPGYRDVVRLGRVVDGTLQLGPRGMLEGTGEQQARIRLVAVSETIETGWLVLTAGHEGLTPQPLVYGVVARAERPQGAPHWEIAVDLAAGADDPTQLDVLCSQVNPARLAAAEASVE